MLLWDVDPGDSPRDLTQNAEAEAEANDVAPSTNHFSVFLRHGPLAVRDTLVCPHQSSLFIETQPHPSSSIGPTHLLAQGHLLRIFFQRKSLLKSFCFLLYLFYPRLSPQLHLGNHKSLGQDGRLISIPCILSRQPLTAIVQIRLRKDDQLAIPIWSPGVKAPSPNPFSPKPLCHP